MENSQTRPASEGPQPVITKIIVENFKSILARQAIEIRPLTILAGANSSGKSSVMQAVLLLKQTLEATYDPGPLLLDGPNVTFTSADQLLSKSGDGRQVAQFTVGIVTQDGTLETRFYQSPPRSGFDIEQTSFSSDGRRTWVLNENMTPDQIAAISNDAKRKVDELFGSQTSKSVWKISRNRCFLQPAMGTGERAVTVFTTAMSATQPLIPAIIHLPGLRGNPSRTYPVAAVGPNYPGTFEKYTASIISRWQVKKKNGKLDGINLDLQNLGLTTGVVAKSVNDTQVELQVGRLPHAPKGGSPDTVNIADVGFGVSQTLPVLVALHVAEPHHLVYLEQPEIHLHPRAQHRLAWVLAAAIKRGVRVVVETHSSILLLGLQTLVANGELATGAVKLNWFSRGNDGSTQITPADLDEAGAFGKWPEDFAEVNLEAESAYLDAAESHLFPKAAT